MFESETNGKTTNTEGRVNRMKMKEYRAALQRMIGGEQRVHIPVIPDDDDVLLHNALDELWEATEEIKRLKDENAEFKHDLEEFKHDLAGWKAAYEKVISDIVDKEHEINHLESQLQDSLNTFVGIVEVFEGDFTDIQVARRAYRESMAAIQRIQEGTNK